jgi:hypothetical protein
LKYIEENISIVNVLKNKNKNMEKVCFIINVHQKSYKQIFMQFTPFISINKETRDIYLTVFTDLKHRESSAGIKGTWKRTGFYEVFA